MIKFIMSIFSLSVLSLTFFKMGKITTQEDNLKTFLKKFGMCLALSFVSVIKFLIMVVSVPIIKLVTKVINNLNKRLLLEDNRDYVEEVVNE